MSQMLCISLPWRTECSRAYKPCLRRKVERRDALWSYRPGSGSSHGGRGNRGVLCLISEWACLEIYTNKWKSFNVRHVCYGSVHEGVGKETQSGNCQAKNASVNIISQLAKSTFALARQESICAARGPTFRFARRTSSFEFWPAKEVTKTYNRGHIFSFQ